MDPASSYPPRPCSAVSRRAVAPHSTDPSTTCRPDRAGHRPADGLGQRCCRLVARGAPGRM